MNEPVTAYGPSDYEPWRKAYSDARFPRVKSAEMIAALDYFWANEGAYARATALAYNGGAYDAAWLRRIAALEAARDTLERLAGVFEDLPAKVKKAILGT